MGKEVGDHRPIIVDIAEASIFGSVGTPSFKLRVRILKLNNPIILQKPTQLDTKIIPIQHKVMDQFEKSGRIGEQ